MTNYCLVKYAYAKNLIREGDILLFRGTSIISRMVKIAGGGLYSHVGIASLYLDKPSKTHKIECLEFKEWIGSRAVALEGYVQRKPAVIDVFRPLPEFKENVYLCKTGKIDIVTKRYDPFKITSEFRDLTGLPYGWARIGWLLKNKIPFLRLFQSNKIYDDNPYRDVHPVCSTILAYLFNKHYTDLLKFRADYKMEPSDIARSPILNYLFTLTT